MTTATGTPVFVSVGGDVSLATATYTPTGSTAKTTETIAQIAQNASGTSSSLTDIQKKVDANFKRISDVFISVSDYGATGSTFATTGTISAGSNSLVVADASDFSIGQNISIAGAGNTTASNLANTGYLVSEITGISGTTITIADTAVSSVSGASVQHDDRDAIQSAIQAVFDVGGGVVFFPAGVYNMAGPFLSNSYSMLKIPNNQPDAEPITVTLQGAFNGSTAYAEMFTGPIPQNGVIINTLANAAGTNWAIVNGAGGGLVWSFTTVNIDSMTFRLPSTSEGPACNGLYFGNTANVNLSNVTVDTDVEGSALPQPTNTNGVAVILPPANNYGNITCRNVYVTGYYIGISHSEHAILDGVFIQQCANAINIVAGYHNAVYVRVLMQECPNLFIASGQLPIYGVLDIETYSVDNSKWWTQKSLTTGTGKVTGKLIYTSTAAGIGYSDLTGFSSTCPYLKFESERGINQPSSAVTVSASPFSYTPDQSGTVAISDGTVSSVTITRSGTVIATGMTSGMFPVAANDTLIVTYTAAPTMVFLP